LIYYNREKTKTLIEQLLNTPKELQRNLESDMTVVLWWIFNLSAGIIQIQPADSFTYIYIYIYALFTATESATLLQIWFHCMHSCTVSYGTCIINLGQRITTFYLSSKYRKTKGYGAKAIWASFSANKCCFIQ